MSADRGAAAVLDRLRALPEPARAEAVRKLAERGLLGTVDAPPARLVPASTELTSKQRALWTLDHDGRHGDFYHCGALWFAPEVSADALAAACRTAATGFDALHRVVDAAGGAPRAVPAPAPEPVAVAVPPGAADPRAWVAAHARAVAGGPLDPARAAAKVTVYRLPDGTGALAVAGHDVHLDQQGLTDVLAPAVAAAVAGREPPGEPVRITDVAAWQRQRLTDGVLSVVAGLRRGALRDAPPCPWPTGGDRTGRRVPVVSGPAAWDRLQAVAARAGVSPAAAAFAAWYRALAGFEPRTARAPIGCCTTLRLRPELAGTLGNLTNTVVVVPGTDWPGTDGPDLLGPVHRALREALGAVDVPFELVFGDGAVQDEQIGIRFTFVEHAPAGPDTLLRPAPVTFSYAKSVLSFEVHVGHAGLEAWIDHRPAYVSAPQADRLAAGLRRVLP